MHKFRTATHCIFDLDGVILDTENLYKRIIENIIRKYNRNLPDHILSKMIGRTDIEKSIIAVEDLKLPMNKTQFHERLKCTFYNSIQRRQVPLQPGADRLINHLYRNRVPLAICSNCSRKDFYYKIEKHSKFFAMFDVKVSAEDFDKDKPAPDIYITCANRFCSTMDRTKCLVFDDAPDGITAALSAGMQCVMVPPKVLDIKFTRNATATVNSLNDVKLEDWGFPILP